MIHPSRHDRPDGWLTRIFLEACVRVSAWPEWKRKAAARRNPEPIYRAESLTMLAYFEELQREAAEDARLRHQHSLDILAGI